MNKKYLLCIYILSYGIGAYGSMELSADSNYEDVIDGESLLFSDMVTSLCKGMTSFVPSWPGEFLQAEGGVPSVHECSQVQETLLSNNDVTMVIVPTESKKSTSFFANISPRQYVRNISAKQYAIGISVACVVAGLVAYRLGYFSAKKDIDTIENELEEVTDESMSEERSSAVVVVENSATFEREVL